MNKLLLTIAFIFPCLHGLSQGTYIYLLSNYTDPQIHYLHDDNTSSLIVEMDEESPIFVDIAVTPSGIMYGITHLDVLHEIDLLNGSSAIITTLPSSLTALVSDSESNLYTMTDAGDIYSFNTLSGELLFVHNVDDWTPGDMTFLNGYLIYPSFNNYGIIKAYNLETEQVSNIYCFPEEVDLSSFGFFGITNRFNNCGSEELILSSGFNFLYLVDVYSGTLEILDFELEDTEYYLINGMTSSGDIEASQCDGFVPEVDCTSVGLEENENTAWGLPFYPNPADSFINMNSSVTIDRIDFVNMTGVIFKTIIRPENQVPIDDLKSGIYFIRIASDTGHTVTHKLIKY